MFIFKKTDKQMFDRLCELRRLLDYNFALDLIVYTPEEIELVVQKGNDIVKAIYEEGVVLYEQ